MSEQANLLNQLQKLRLPGVMQAFKEQIEMPSHYLEMDFEERLGYLLQREMETRQQKRVMVLKSLARLRLSASMESLDFTQPGRLNRQEILRLGSCEFIRRNQNLLITGPTGVGKTYLATALAERAIQNGITTRYVRASLLYQEFLEARNRGLYRKKLQEYQRIQFLLIDDFGLEKLNHQEALDFLEVMDQKTQTGSVAIITQISMSSWDKVIEEQALSEAILDRFIHTATQIHMKGESMRKITKSS